MRTRRDGVGRGGGQPRRDALPAAPAGSLAEPPRRRRSPRPCPALPAPGWPGGRGAFPLSGEEAGAGWRGGPAREESYNDIPGRVPLTAPASQSACAGEGDCGGDRSPRRGTPRRSRRPRGGAEAGTWGSGRAWRLPPPGPVRPRRPGTSPEPVEPLRAALPARRARRPRSAPAFLRTSR